MEDSKRWFTSKTIWLAVLQGVAGIVAALLFEFPELAIIGVVKSVIDVFLRVLTTRELG